MTILSPLDGAQLSVSRYAYEASLHRILAELCTTFIPLVTRSAQIADANGAARGSPEHAAVIALYFSVNSMRNQAILMAQNLAQEERRYKSAVPLLSLNANPEPLGFSRDSLHEFDVRARQWRQNIYKFIRKIDRNAPVLFTRTPFDMDPPRARRIARKQIQKTR